MTFIKSNEISYLFQHGEVMRAVILGGTGLVGRALTRRLLTDNEFTQIIAVSRRSLQIKHEKFKEILIENLDELKKKQGLLEGDVYFCCLGTTMKKAQTQEQFRKIDFTAVVQFGEVAVFHGGQTFIALSAQGAKETAVNFYLHVKGEMELSLMNLGLRNLILFRPALLVSSTQRLEARPLEDFFVSLFKNIESILPEFIRKRWATSVEVLVSRMISEAKQKNSGVKIIHAAEI